MKLPITPKNPRRLLLVVLFFVAGFLVAPAPAPAAGPDPAADLPRQRERMRRLLDGLPPQAELLRSIEVFNKPGTAKDAGELRQARQHVRLAQRRIPRILTLLQSRAFGQSIFDYPGLLAVGKMDFYVEKERDSRRLIRYYSLHFGGEVHPQKSSQKPWEFITHFGEKGTILQTDDLICRH